MGDRPGSSSTGNVRRQQESDRSANDMMILHGSAAAGGLPRLSMFLLCACGLGLGEVDLKGNLQSFVR